MSSGQWLRAGRVGRPHGLDGSFHVVAATPQLLELGMELVVDGKVRRITRRAGHDRRPIIALEGCEGRSAAQALHGQDLVVAREEAPELAPDEWWAEDLEGCQVHQGEHVVGTVSKLMALPSVDVLEVSRPDGQGDLLVPLVADAVLSVDVERREIEVDLRFLGEA